MDKRRFERIKVDDCPAVDLSDGNGFFTGGVKDISRNGLRLTDVSNRLNIRTGKLTVVFSANGKNFKMNVRPKWFSEKHQSKSIGVEILNVPRGWTEFVMTKEPQNKEHDPWGRISLLN